MARKLKSPGQIPLPGRIKALMFSGKVIIIAPRSININPSKSRMQPVGTLPQLPST